MAKSDLPKLTLSEQLVIQKHSYMFKQAIESILAAKACPTIKDFNELITIFEDLQTQNQVKLKLAEQLFKKDKSPELFPINRTQAS